jgi:glycosyltransferase involved in cell wall biosynthesis
MKIAVDTRNLAAGSPGEYTVFQYEVLKRITRNNPSHEFLFFFGRSCDSRFVFAENITPVITGPVTRNPLLWKWWYDVKLPALLKKYKVDLFVSCNGLCSLRTPVPQCMIVHDLAFLHYPSFFKRVHLFFYKHYTPEFLQKANAIATLSEFSKKDIMAAYKVNADRIDVVYSAARDIFGPAGEKEKELTKERYTDGKNYFIYTGISHPCKNLINLLKAFSIFKKRQQSNWKLVLTGRPANRFTEMLRTYKYRDEVVLTGETEENELAKITGSAYALVYPSLCEGFGMPVLEAMSSRVPVIASANSPMQEVAGDAALYADPTDQQDIADKMMRLYKDESLRQVLIEKGEQKARSYSWDRTAGLLWQSILKCKPANKGV